MTKADIVDTIASGTGLTKVETEAVVDGFIHTVINSLCDGRNIEIRGFGSFKVKERKGRMARNPRTGAQVPVEDHYVPLFKVSKELKAKVNESMKQHPPAEKPVKKDVTESSAE
ncbi:MAG: HU family DNA-binding protein [Acidobacteriota bacterium]